MNTLVLPDELDSDVSVKFYRKKINSRLSPVQEIRFMVEKFIEILKIDIDLDDTSNFIEDDVKKCGILHTVGILHYYDAYTNPRYAHHTWIFDYDNSTKEYTVGPTTTWPNDKYKAIYKYMIDFISECGTDIYFGSFYVSNDQLSADKQMDNLKKYGSNLKWHNDITETLSFFGTTCINGIWYNKLPVNGINKGIKSLPPEYKLTQAFINNFKGVKNKGTAYENAYTKVTLYTCMFDDFNDFCNVAKLFILNNYEVDDEYNKSYNLNNYEELLNIDKIRKNDDDFKTRQSVLDDEATKLEEKSKQTMIGKLGKETCEKFEQLNDGSIQAQPLSVYMLTKPVKAKNIYRKFDMPVLYEFFKNNDISFSKFTEESSERARKLGCQILEDFKKWKDLSSINDDMALYMKKMSERYGNILKAYAVNIFNSYASNKKALLNDLFKEYIETTDDDINNYTDDTDDDTAVNMLLNYFAKMSNYNKYLYYNNETLLARRFICLLIKYTYEYDIYQTAGDNDVDFNTAFNNWTKTSMSKSKYESNKHMIDPYLLLDDNDIITDGSYYKSYDAYIPSHGTSLKECNFKLSSYTRLYAFYYCLAKALKNAFKIKVFNSFHDDFNVKTELDENAEPDMQSVNFDAINKMIQTALPIIIDKKIKENDKYNNTKVF